MSNPADTIPPPSAEEATPIDTLQGLRNELNQLRCDHESLKADVEQLLIKTAELGK
jgi:hypothetical protein